jgi:hypothetical protein
MKGKPGDGAIFVDQEGNEWKAVLTDETMSGNASLVYAESEEDEFTQDSIHMAFNIPTEEEAIGNGPYYKHRPNAKWPNDLL